MKDPGASKKILGMEILRNKVAIRLSLSQKGYIEKVLRRFNMQNEACYYPTCSSF